MTALRIQEHTAAGSLAGTELVPVAKLSTTVTTTASDISAAASGNTFTRGTGSWVTDGFAVGDSVKSSGWTGGTANNKTARTITALSATVMTFGGTDGDDIVDDAGGEAVTVTKWEAAQTSVADIAAEAGSGTGTKTYAHLDATTSFPPTSNYATQTTLANGIPVLAFDGGSTNEAARWIRTMPEAASLGSGLKVTIKFSMESATTGNVRWGARFMRLNADISVDGFDTAVENHVAVSADVDDPAEVTLTITTIDSIVAHDAYMIEVYRDASDTTNDTATGDAYLHSVEVWSAA